MTKVTSTRLKHIASSPYWQGIIGGATESRHNRSVNLSVLYHKRAFRNLVRLKDIAQVVAFRDGTPGKKSWNGIFELTDGRAILVCAYFCYIPDNDGTVRHLTRDLTSILVYPDLATLLRSKSLKGNRSGHYDGLLDTIGKVDSTALAVKSPVKIWPFAKKIKPADKTRRLRKTDRKKKFQLPRKDVDADGIQTNEHWRKIFNQATHRPLGWEWHGNRSESEEWLTDCDVRLSDIDNVIAAVNGNGDEWPWMGVFKMCDGSLLLICGELRACSCSVDMDVFGSLDAVFASALWASEDNLQRLRLTAGSYALDRGKSR